MGRDKGFYEIVADEKDRIYVNINYENEDVISRPHYHNAVELNVVLKGELGCWVDGKKYWAKPGQMLYCNSMNVHFFDIKKGTETLYFVADTSLLKDFQNLYASEAGKPTFPVLLESVEKNQEISPMRSIVYHQVAEKKYTQKRDDIQPRKGRMIYQACDLDKKIDKLKLVDFLAQKTRFEAWRKGCAKENARAFSVPCGTRHPSYSMPKKRGEYSPLFFGAEDEI